MIYKRLLLLFFIFLNHFATAQEWKLVNTDNSALHSDYIKDVVVDTNGIVWVGAFTDISSFDGLNWNHYIITNTYNPNINTILDMHLLNDNNILIGTSNGLCIFNTLTKTADFSLNQNIPFIWINSVGQTADGKLWIGEGVNGGRVAYYENGIWYSFQIFSSSAPIYSIDNRNNEMWFGSFFLKQYENGVFNSYGNWNCPIVNGQSVHSLKFDSFGSLWLDAPTNLGQGNYRLLKFDGTTWESFDSLTCVPLSMGHYISSILPLDSVVWFSLQYNGIIKYNYYTTSCDYYTESNCILSSNNFSCIETDKNKNIYIGTDDGLIIYNENKIFIDAYKYTDIYVYPNPFDDIITLRFLSESNQEVETAIFNELGQIIYKNNFPISSGRIEFPIIVDNLSRGTYIAKFKINNQILTKKLVKIN